MKQRTPWLLRGALLLLGGVLIGLTAAACDSDGDGEASAEEIQAVEQIINQVLGSGSAEAEFFFEHVTDNLIESVLFSNREDCTANAAECIGDPAGPATVAGTTIDGDSASSTVTVEFGIFEIGLVRDGDVWMVDSFTAADDDIPEGAAAVDLGLADFSFDIGDIPDEGDFYFHVTNNGAQPHEVVVVPIPAEGDLEELIQGLGDETQPVGFKVFIQEDQEVDMAFESPLTAGRYAMVCFFPDIEDPNQVPHAEKGMIAEFTIE